MTIRNWIDFFCDKRFGWRFKIANLFMNDYLRNYLTIDMIPLKNAINWIDRHPDMAKGEIADVIHDVEELFEM